jgi:hypothetical protein
MNKKFVYQVGNNKKVLSCYLSSSSGRVPQNIRGVFVKRFDLVISLA